MPIKHSFTSAVADGGDATLVRPSNWNADHAAPPFVVTLLTQHGAVTWLNMPAALEEWNGITRTRILLDLTNVAQARCTAAVSTGGAAGAEARIQYSTDQTTWAYLDGVDGPKVSIATSLSGAASPWVNLVAGAKTDVWVRVVGIGGDGVADPVVGLITLQLR